MGHATKSNGTINVHAAVGHGRGRRSVREREGGKKSLPWNIESLRVNYR